MASRHRLYGNDSRRSLSFQPAEAPYVKILESRLRRNIFTLILIFATGIFLTLTFVYAWAIAHTTGSLTSLVPARTATAVGALAVLSHVSSFLLMSLCASTLEAVVWTLASCKEGLTVSSLLAISPTTGVAGLFRLLGRKNSEEGQDNHRKWVGFRHVVLLWRALIVRLLLLAISLPIGFIIMSTSF